MGVKSNFIITDFDMRKQSRNLIGFENSFRPHLENSYGPTVKL